MFCVIEKMKCNGFKEYSIPSNKKLFERYAGMINTTVNSPGDNPGEISEPEPVLRMRKSDILSQGSAAFSRKFNAHLQALNKQDDTDVPKPTETPVKPVETSDTVE